MFNVLVACEESQRVCIEFRKRGINAYSCDILDCSGGHPEWHIKTNCLFVMNGETHFHTMDGNKHYINKWDLIIAHPPCTYLTITGNRWYNIEKYGFKAIERKKQRNRATNFFMSLVGAKCDHIAVENPIGCMSTHYRKPDQIVHPYMFGDPERKATCLWLKNLPKLEPTNIVEPNIIKYKNGKGTDSPWHMDTMKLPPAERAKARSKTFPGIAEAMAKQWGDYLIMIDKQERMLNSSFYGMGV